MSRVECLPGCTCRGLVEPGTPSYDAAIAQALQLIQDARDLEASTKRHPSNGADACSPEGIERPDLKLVTEW